MSLSIGKQLKEARMKQGLTTEDITHETRISEAHLRQLEEDDYSNFPNPTYARSFLAIYSEYLEVDAEDVIEAMHGPKNGKSKGGEFDRDYLKPKITLAPPNTTIPIHKNLIVQKPGKPVLLLMLVFLLLVSLPTVYYFSTQAGYDQGQKDAEEAAAAVAAATPNQNPAAADDNVDQEPAVDNTQQDNEQLNAIIRGSNGNAANNEPQTPAESEGGTVRAIPIENPDADTDGANESQPNSASATTTPGTPDPT